MQTHVPGHSDGRDRAGRILMASRELWVFLFMLGVMVFNWPFLEIFSDSLPYFLFGGWGAYILVVMLVSTVMQRRGD